MNKHDSDADHRPQTWAHRTIGKKELADLIAVRCGTSKQLAGRVVDTFLNGIAEALLADLRIELRRWGVFECVERAARPAFDMNTGQPIEVPPRTVVRFRPGSQLAAVVAKKGAA